MKKITIFILIAVFLATPLSGCKNDSLAMNDNGEIAVGELKQSFEDGTYYAHNSYCNDEGYICAMKTIVKNGLITQIIFDYIDCNGLRYSNISNSEMQNDIQYFKTTVKNLCTNVLANQDYANVRNMANDKISKDFLALIALLFPQMQQGNTETVVLNQAEAYTAISDRDYYGFYSMLTVEYISDKINLISFSLIDSSGSSVSSSDIPDEALPKESQYTYAGIIKMINTIPSDKETLYKQPASNEWSFLYSMYNSLTYDIQIKHKAANINIEIIL